MRKTKFGLMALCSMMALTACGGSETNSTPATSKTEDSVPEKVTITFEQYDIIIDKKGNSRTLSFGDNLFATYQLEFDYGHVIDDTDIRHFSQRNYMDFKMPSEEVKENGGLLTECYLDKGKTLIESTPLEIGTELVQDMTVYFSFFSRSQWFAEEESDNIMPVINNRKAVDNPSESSEEDTVTITFEQYDYYFDSVRDAYGNSYFTNYFFNDTLLSSCQLSYPIGHVLTEEDIKEQEDYCFRNSHTENGSGFVSCSSVFLNKDDCMCWLDCMTAGMKLEKSFTAYFSAHS